MNFEPQKFFIGLVDFFSILMPGALVVYLGKNWAGTDLLGQTASALDDAEDWMVFLFASYLLGHFAFLLGSLLDDWLYEPLRKCTYWGQIGRLAKGKDLIGYPLRTLAASHWLFGRNADAAVMQAQRLMAGALQPISAEGAVNAYQWCKARLSKDHPDGLVAVQRFEADSKFFRSFAVVLTLLAFGFAFQQFWLAALACTGLLLLSLWRYIDQRFKATQQAYWYIITLAGMQSPTGPIALPSRTSAGLTHAGGIVFRNCGAAIEYLLVEANSNRAQWVLPKGHIELGEDPRETAVREVKEESGNWARVVRWIEDTRFGADANSPVVRLQRDPGKAGDGAGSIIVVIATDAPLLASSIAARHRSCRAGHGVRWVEDETHRAITPQGFDASFSSVASNCW